MTLPVNQQEAQSAGADPVLEQARTHVPLAEVARPCRDLLYHRLLNCGVRVAATAGSDVFLSVAHGPGVALNPPGWGRMYADLADESLSIAAYPRAIRAGRSMATTGPFLMVDVAGSGPGTTVTGAELPVRDHAAECPGTANDSIRPLSLATVRSRPSLPTPRTEAGADAE